MDAGPTHPHGFDTLADVRVVGVFALVALAELAVFVAVESRIGLGNALLIALGTAVVGSMMVRRAGLTVMGDVRRRMSEGVLPGRELSHGAAILVAGALLISPGFLTDAIGFTLLVPAVRDLLHAAVTRRLSGRVTVFGPAESTRPAEDVIEAEAWEVDDPDET